MDSISTSALFGLFIFLIFCSGFFSSSETGLFSLNRYRLKHLVKKKHKGAIRTSQLLHQPDRLIGVILIGNNFVNILITLVAAQIAERFVPEWARDIVTTISLTFILLIFAEVTPKSLAAAYPDKIAFPASWLLRPLLTLLYPVVWIINLICNSIARIFGLSTSEVKITDHLHPEELRTVVDESGDLIPDKHQDMLLNVLDLEKATVEDILIPRNEIVGIDLEDDIDEIIGTLRTTEYARLPVFEGDINRIVGVLRLRNLAKFVHTDQVIDHKKIRELVTPPYFVPESTSLPTQLMNFQAEKERMAIVVDEYGDVLGVATMVDLLEEIVGDFATDTADEIENDIIEDKDQSYIIDASTSIRDINRNLGWQLPTNGPKTLNGIIVEFLENIPDARVSFEIGNYRFEIQEIGDTRIGKARVKEMSTD